MHTARKDLAMQAFDRLGLTGRNSRLAPHQPPKAPASRPSFL